MSYNGWKNYETWNTVLWILNYEGLYEQLTVKCRRIKNVEMRWDAGMAMLFCNDAFLDNATPDGVNLEKGSVVDWDEVANCFNEILDEDLQ